MPASPAPLQNPFAAEPDQDVSLFNPLPHPILNRLLVLLAGNIILLIAIFSLLKPGSSFLEVLKASSPNAAPVILAGLGLTGIIYTRAIDLSIASILVVAGTMFGICVNRGVSTIGSYIA